MAQSSLFQDESFKADLVDTPDKFHKLLQRCQHATEVGFDTESAGPLLYNDSSMINIYRSTIVGFSVAFEDGYCAYVPTGHGKRRLPSRAVERFLRALPKGCIVWAHNWKHDYQSIKLEGYEMPRHLDYRDSMVAAFSAHAGVPTFRNGEVSYSYGLKKLIPHHLMVGSMTFTDAISSKLGILGSAPKNVAKYACQDALCTLKLGKQFFADLPAGNADYFLKYDMPFVFLLADMEMGGIGLDRQGIRDTYRLLNPKAHALREAFETRWGCSIGSDTQVRAKFYGEGLWDAKLADVTAGGQPKVDAKALRLHAEKASTEEARQAASARLEWKGYNKIISTYTWPLVDMADDYPDGKLHGQFNPVGTVTGRLSSSKPNMQNIVAHGEYAGRIKQAFVPDEGRVFVSADYSQLEYRLLAHYAGGALREAYNSGKSDVHQAMADLVGVDRKSAKMLNFGIVYGRGPTALGQDLKMTYVEAKRFLDRYLMRIPEVDKLKKAVWQKGRACGWLKMVSGVQRAVPGLDNPDSGKRGRAERQAFNKLFQGSAAEIAKIAMLNTQQKLGKRGRVVLQVHDEICIEVSRKDGDAAARLLQTEMENAIKLSVPLKAEPTIGTNWGECK